MQNMEIMQKLSDYLGRMFRQRWDIDHNVR